MAWGQKKIIIFPGNYVPHVGGLETHVDMFAKHFSRYAEITIFTPMVKDGIQYETRYGNVKVIRYPSFEIVNDFYIPKFWTPKFWKMFSKLYKTKFDYVMTRTMFFTNSTIGMKFAKFRFKPLKLIHVEHGSSYPKTNDPLVWLFSRFYIFFIGNIHTKLSDRIVCVSEMSKEYVESFWHNCPIDVIYRGVDFDKIKSIETKKLPPKSIVYAGRLTEGKGISDLIEAVSDEKYNVYIIGDGGLKNQLKEISSKSKSNIIFTGKLSYEETISYIKGCDVFVNPSYSEGLPTSVLDAFFSGCKIVATDVGGTKEILDNDWNTQRYKLVKEKNPNDLRKAIKDVLKTKNDIDKKLVLRIKKKFDWEKHAEMYEKILNRW